MKHLQMATHLWKLHVNIKPCVMLTMHTQDVTHIMQRPQFILRANESFGNCF